METAISDLIAGITTGLTVIPQGIAYALVANLPPQYGLYSAFMGSFMYCIFGGCKEIAMGPTAIMAIMTGDAISGGKLAEFGPHSATLLTFLSGVICLVFGILKLGFLIDFISAPVISGFVSAAALTIASGQIKGLLGVSNIHRTTPTQAGVVDDYSKIWQNLDTVRWQDAVLGFTCVALLLALRVSLDIGKPFQPPSPAKCNKCFQAPCSQIYFVKSTPDTRELTDC